jgi:iron(III) transport system ATP-binding protein|tara:strand:- start:1892 stop:3028 length:1137 start_codon:yes stop_codon:yes gene_type:complete
MISLENLVKRFPLSGGDKVAVDNISFDLPKGEFFTLLGPSGCGKTTTLRSIAGLEKPTAGTISIDGEKVYDNKVIVPANKRGLGMVFQSYAVWPHMSVFENVAFPLHVADERPSRSEVKRRVHETLELVDLGGLGQRPATMLSGGQQQRLSLARALVKQPKMLLLDEPLSNLDAKLRDRMRSELRVIQQHLGITTLFVTHDQVEALSMSDRVAVMNNGKIEQIGGPRDVYHDPLTAFVADFIGGANTLDGIVEAVEPDGSAILSTECGRILGRGLPDLVVGRPAVASIHLEDVQLSTDEATNLSQHNVFEGVVSLGLFNGPSVVYRLYVGDQLIEAQLGGHDAFAQGTEIRVILPKRHIRILQRGPEDLAPARGVEEK